MTTPTVTINDVQAMIDTQLKSVSSPDSSFQRGYRAALRAVSAEIDEAIRPEPPFTARHILIYALPKQFRIVGPFNTEQELVQWGNKWQAENNDDPRWQQIELKVDPMAKHIWISVDTPS